MELDPSTFRTTSPEEVAQTVRTMSGREVSEVMRGKITVRGDVAAAAQFPSMYIPKA